MYTTMGYLAIDPMYLENCARGLERILGLIKEILIIFPNFMRMSNFIHIHPNLAHESCDEIEPAL